MSITVYIAFFSWIALSIWLASRLGSIRGVPAIVAGGFLLLPPASISLIDGIPPLDRGLAIAASAFLATLLFDPGAFRRYRFHWLDLFPLTAVFAWSTTNLLNGTGASQFLLDFWWYGMFALVPYFLARCLLSGVTGLRATAIAIVASSIILIPLVLYEVRMSPILNSQIYGFSTGNVMERFRFDGWRPRVFQPAGLGLAVWLAGAAVVAWSLYLGATKPTILRLPASVAAWCCLVLGFLSRGAGAIALMIMGLVALLLARWLNLRKLALVIPALCAIYLASALVDSSLPIRPVLLDAADGIFGVDRAASLETRFRNEEILVTRALQKPLFGWGGWGDYRLAYDLAAEAGMTTILTDGFWVITLGKRGLIGLMATWGWFLVPAALAVWHAQRIGLPRGTSLLILGLALFSWIFAIDLLFNGFPSPVQGLVAGTLATFVAQASRMPKGAAVRSTTGVTARQQPLRGVPVDQPSLVGPRS
jgi:hypothetical protein